MQDYKRSQNKTGRAGAPQRIRRANQKTAKKRRHERRAETPMEERKILEFFTLAHDATLNPKKLARFLDKGIGLKTGELSSLYEAAGGAINLAEQREKLIEEIPQHIYERGCPS